MLFVVALNLLLLRGVLGKDDDDLTAPQLRAQYNGLCLITYEEAMIDLHGVDDYGHYKSKNCAGNQVYMNQIPFSESQVKPLYTPWQDVNQEELPLWCLLPGLSDVRGDFVWCESSTGDTGDQLNKECATRFGIKDLCGCAYLQILQPNDNWNATFKFNFAFNAFMDHNIYRYQSVADGLNIDPNPRFHLLNAAERQKMEKECATTGPNNNVWNKGTGNVIWDNMLGMPETTTTITTTTIGIGNPSPSPPTPPPPTAAPTAAPSPPPTATAAPTAPPTPKPGETETTTTATYTSTTPTTTTATTTTEPLIELIQLTFSDAALTASQVDNTVTKTALKTMVVNLITNVTANQLSVAIQKQGADGIGATITFPSALSAAAFRTAFDTNRPVSVPLKIDGKTVNMGFSQFTTITATSTTVTTTEVTATSTTVTTTEVLGDTATTTQTPASKSSGLSTGGLAAVIVGSVVVLVLLVRGILYWKYQQRKKEKPGENDDGMGSLIASLML